MDKKEFVKEYLEILNKDLILMRRASYFFAINGIILIVLGTYLILWSL